MISFVEFLRDFFCLANAQVAAGEAGDGRAFEERVARHFLARGVRSCDVFSGVRSLGSQSLSGLYHQIDSTGRTRDAVVIGEWKTYHGSIPKNDLLRFKAATDDYWLRQHPFADAPVLRVFGGTGVAPPALRRYAAQWGICLVTQDRWPAPLLASDATHWPDVAPNARERAYLAWLARPLNQVCAPQPDGSWAIPRPIADSAVDHLLTLQDHWSGQLWQRFRARPGSFDEWVSATVPWGNAA